MKQTTNEWVEMANRKPPYGKEVILFRGSPSGLCYHLIGHITKDKTKMVVSLDGRERYPCDFFKAWSHFNGYVD